MTPNPSEAKRLVEDERRERDWKRWGPYLSERQWGTVREDYSGGGHPWEYFTHDQARSRAYRWGEDGLLGMTDRQCRLCFGLALWNGRDSILKERLYGLSNHEGNHGEDVKENYYYLDATPTYSYLKALYKYPQAAFPYERLLAENRSRTRLQPEFELADTGIFDAGRYFDVFAEYAKGSPNDLLIRITLCNRGPEAAALHVLPSLWFRNTWSWGRAGEGYWNRGRITREGESALQAEHEALGKFTLHAATLPGGPPPEWLFTENDTNSQLLFGDPSDTPYTKDAFHRYLVSGERGAVNPMPFGSKAAAHHALQIPAGGEAVLRLRLCAATEAPAQIFGPAFDATFAQRIAEADAFYAERIADDLGAEQRRVTRQAYAGLLWSKQFYHYSVKDWLEGDPAQPPPPPPDTRGRNQDWPLLYNRDVLSMPDTWEYPWYASWDLAFHMIPLCKVDPLFAKKQLILLLREWYMHPSGQIPAYEFNFSDVNPPVHAWACWRVYKMTGATGHRDRLFLARVFNKLVLNFTWWVNRKDLQGNNLFSGGFLGLDNIGVFDHSRPMPSGAIVEQADATAWMAFFCLTMLEMALELAKEDEAYGDMASKFFEHFIAIADAANRLGGTGLWDEEDGFYYDRLHSDGTQMPLRVRSLVGALPLFAVSLLENEAAEHAHGFMKRADWFLENRKDLAGPIAYMNRPGEGQGGKPHKLLALPSRERLTRMLRFLLDEKEFLSPHGVRSMSRIHLTKPFLLRVDGSEAKVDYEPGESTSAIFGGNSNWRGPIWFPLNFLLIESLERYHHFYGDTLKVECPVGSGKMLNLKEVSEELAARLGSLFLPDANGHRPCHGADARYATDPHWKDLVLFHEYFHAETGQGLGASHQTGWTSLVTRCYEKLDGLSDGIR